jgi:hypothetical protein
LKRVAATILIGSLLTAGTAAAQPVQIKIESAGFEAGVMARYVIRYGQWFPILVSLDAVGTQGQAQQVTLRCTSVDIDGDRVEFLETPVTITTGVSKRVWLYATTSELNIARQMTVDVLSDDGVLITRSDPINFEAISGDYQLILDIAQSALPGLRAIDSGGGDYFDRRPGNRPYYRGICVARLPAGDLPDNWIGLDAVDVIVWDEAHPDQLQNPAQAEALRDWVHRGGQLVVGLGASWNKLRQGRLADLIPYTGGTVMEVDQLPQFLSAYAATGVDRFDDPIAIAVAQRSPDGLSLMRDIVDDRPIDLIAMKPYGFGRVIACSARLRDLFASAPPKALLAKLLDLNPNTEGFLKSETEAMLGVTPTPLFPPIAGPTEFRGQASLLVMMAFLFVGLYIAVTAGASWFWLQRKGLTQISWTVFAGFAVVASVLSIGAVRLVRGVSDTVHSFTFVNLNAGSSNATADVLFGYKSATRQAVDLRVNSDAGYLRGMTGSGIESAYATPERYAALPRQGAVERAPMRATLKQFEASWQGAIDGAIRVQLTADRRNGRITAESWISNEMQVDVLGGYLLYIDPRLTELGAVPPRVAGLTQRSDRSRYLGNSVVPPAVNVLVVPVPPVAAGQRVADLGKGDYADFETSWQRWKQSAETPDSTNEPTLPTLWNLQTRLWINSVKAGLPFTARLEPEMAASLLASTRNLFLHSDGSKDFDKIGTNISTRGLVDQDVTHWLMGGDTQGVGVLLLFAHEPGPAALIKGAREISASRGSSLYRVRAPIRWKS